MADGEEQQQEEELSEPAEPVCVVGLGDMFSTGAAAADADDARSHHSDASDNSDIAEEKLHIVRQRLKAKVDRGEASKVSQRVNDQLNSEKERKRVERRITAHHAWKSLQKSHDADTLARLKYLDEMPPGDDGEHNALDGHKARRERTEKVCQTWMNSHDTLDHMLQTITGQHDKAAIEVQDAATRRASVVQGNHRAQALLSRTGHTALNKSRLVRMLTAFKGFLAEVNTTYHRTTQMWFLTCPMTPVVSRSQVIHSRMHSLDSTWEETFAANKRLYSVKQEIMSLNISLFENISETSFSLHVAFNMWRQWQIIAKTKREELVGRMEKKRELRALELAERFAEKNPHFVAHLVTGAPLPRRSSVAITSQMRLATPPGQPSPSASPAPPSGERKRSPYNHSSRPLSSSSRPLSSAASDSDSAGEASIPVAANESVEPAAASDEPLPLGLATPQNLKNSDSVELRSAAGTFVSHRSSSTAVTDTQHSNERAAARLLFKIQVSVSAAFRSAYSPTPNCTTADDLVPTTHFVQTEAKRQSLEEAKANDALAAQREADRDMRRRRRSSAAAGGHMFKSSFTKSCVVYEATKQGVTQKPSKAS